MTVKNGMSLVEMLVAIGIFTMATVGFSVLFVNTWRSQSFTIETGIASFIASRGVDKVVGVIREARQADNGAYAIESADDFSLTLFGDSNNDGVTERIHYFVENNTFKMGITQPTTSVPPSYPNGDQTVRNVADYIVNNDDLPIFTYYDERSTVLATPATAGDVRMVQVLMLVNVDPIKDPNNVQIQSFVVIRNLSAYGEAPT